MTLVLAPPHSDDEARPRGLGYGVRINRSWYRLATSDEVPLQFLTEDELAERSADGTNSFENMLKTGYAWVRGNFSGGEGLDRYPRSPPSVLDDTRYWRSHNLDLRRPESGRPYEIALSVRPDPWTAVDEPIIDAKTSSSSMYVAYGTTMATFTSKTTTTPTFEFSGFSDEVRNFDISESDEGIALLVDGTVWHKPMATNTWTEVVPVGTEFDNLRAVWICKGRYLGWTRDMAEAAPSELIEIVLGITGTPALPSYAPTVIVVDTFQADMMGLVDAGMAILALLDDGSIHSYVSRADSAGEVPVLTVMSTTPMPKGEIPMAAAYNSGYMCILTLAEGDLLRAYSAQMLDERFNYIIGELVLIGEWTGIAFDHEVTWRQIVVSRDHFVWLVTEDEGTDLWRYDLVTTGLHNHVHVADFADGYNGIASWGADWFSFQRADVNFVTNDEKYPDEGWLITPLINFNLNADINWTELTIQTFALGFGGVQVELAISSNDQAILDVNHPSWRIIAQFTSPTVEVLNIPLLEVTAPKMALRLILRPHTNNTATPKVTQVGLRGIPSASETTMAIPISVSDQVEAPGRMPVRIPGFGNVLFNSLLGLRGASVTVQLVAPPMRLRGVVRSVSSIMSYLSHRGSVGQYTVVTVLGEPIPMGSATLGFGGGGVGFDLVGYDTVGIGET